MPERQDNVIPETHEHIREEDIQETLDIFRDGNDILPRLEAADMKWLATALDLRRDLCSRQYSKDGGMDTSVVWQIKELDNRISSRSPAILKVLHFLSRIRAIIPALMQLKSQIASKETESDPTKKMINQMKYDCSLAEVQAAIEGLAKFRIKPRILEQHKP